MTVGFEAGFVLAALLHGDVGLTQVTPALAPGLEARLERYARAVRAALDTDREGAIRRVASDARALPVEGRRESRRVLAVLATEVPRERGAAWLAAVPRHRPGWSAAPDLKAMLLRSAGPSGEARAASEIAELESAWPG